ncbi:MAG: periplasmic [NiFeSe] hydrogenase small subunit [Acidobacteria bacterium]|jgi:hydrogenase small subunit|nr:periplasmic [NiFeSe] hydrogenase small subunit [Acidobacteriota bacterium]
MILSRRDFLNACKTSSIALGLSAANIISLRELLANPNAPTILWLQGSGCTGCTVSFLNYLSPSEPVDVADLLINDVNLAYHNTAMAAAADTGIDALDAAYAKGGYILAVEGGVPTAFGGHACISWTRDGKEVTFLEAVRKLAARASKILCIGTCASFGGVAAAPPNPTAVQGVESVTGLRTINIAGCPPHPDWIVGTIANLLLGRLGELDDKRRPKALFSKPVHESCPRKDQRQASAYGQDGLCLKNLMCAGPKTRANCPRIGWNNHVNWCIDSNAQCIGCTEPTFARSTLRGVGESRLEA